ncbi:hypothetical protein [Shinella zoogloeoides]|uniref:hypothetical protein n=1 Tax=Shinella zoogloeoides TaxID=352475 RepID=UPI001F576CA4|nr:hypothetical protein [Shinella zoogloeoides]
MTSAVSAIEAIARTVALDVYHNAVDSDDGSHSMDMPVAVALIIEALSPLARQAEALQRENAELRAVMNECHAALKMMISPGDISGSTVLGAFAAAKSAEARARSALAATRSGSATNSKGNTP